MRPGAPLPYPEIVGELPEVAVSGTLLIADPQTQATGSAFPYAYLYCPNAAAPLTSRFYRVNLNTGSYQRLADPMAEATSVAGVGCAMISDPSRPARPVGGGNIDVVLFHPLSAAPWASVTTYDRNNNNWVHLNTAAGDFDAGGLGAAALAAQWGTDAAMVHTCTSINAGGDDTSYWIGGNGNTHTYVLTIAAATVAAMPVGGGARAATGAGITFGWFPAIDVGRVQSHRGNNTGTLSNYVPGGGGTWTDAAIVPAGEVFGAGTAMVPLVQRPMAIGGPEAVIENDGRLWWLNPTSRAIYPIGTMFSPTGAPVVGRRLAMTMVGERSYIYAVKSGTKELWRMRIGY